MSNSDSFWNHPIETLEKALHLRKQIESLQQTLSELFGGHPPSLAGTQTAPAKVKGKRTMSAAARNKIAAAQKARWAKSKGAKAEAPIEETAAPVAKAKKGGMSAAGKARIAAAQKARWAKIKGQKAAASPAPAKVAAAPKKKKGGMSAEGRARIVAAQKLRWAKFKKAKK